MVERNSCVSVFVCIYVRVSVSACLFLYVSGCVCSYADGLVGGCE